MMRQHILGYQEDEAAYTCLSGDVCLWLFNAMPASQWDDSFFSSFQMWVFLLDHLYLSSQVFVGK